MIKLVSVGRFQIKKSEHLKTTALAEGFLVRHEKKSRIKDRKFLDTFHNQPCVVCGITPSDPDHIKTVKSGGGDEAWNIWPLCRLDHIKKHTIGLNELVRRYPHVKNHLLSRGWHYDDLKRKWRRY